MAKSINIRIRSRLIMTKYITRIVALAVMTAAAFVGCVDVSNATDGRADEFLRTFEETQGATVTGITAEYAQGTTVVYPGTALNSLKAGLTVTARYSDGTTRRVPDTAYDLSGALAVGASTVTVRYGGQTATFTVTVTLPDIPDAPLTGISVEYNPDPSTAVFPTTPLNNLKNDLTVIAIYGDGTEIPVAPEAYMLSGTLAGGASRVITVTYTERGVTRTANFTVAVAVPPEFDSISIVYNQTFPIHYNTPVGNLTRDLTVTAHFRDGTTRVLDSAEYVLYVSGNNGAFVENSTATMRANVCLSLGFGVTDFFTPGASPACVKEFTVEVVPPPDFGRLYAKAPPILQSDIPVDLSMIVALSEIDRAFLYMNANPGTYTFVLDGDIEVAPHSATQITSGMANRHLKSSGTKLTIIGDGTMRKISLRSSGRMFTIGDPGVSGIEFTIGNNITLDGYADCADYGRFGIICTYSTSIFIRNEVEFNMQDNAQVSRTGVDVRDAAFTMQNYAAISDGTGVTLSNSVFTMRDNAKVSDNFGTGVSALSGTATMRDNASVSGSSGRGVSVSGTFNMMNNASVHGNEETGVSIIGDSTIFTMQDNSSVYANKERGITASGTVIMRDNASVYGNTASNGAGVSVSGTFTMRDGASIYGNTATGDGGGVYVNIGFDGSTFIMEDEARVYGNTANRGGGVFVNGSASRGGVFTMRGGTVYGINEGELLSNTARTMAAALFVVTGGEARFDDDTNIIPVGNGRDVTIRR
jgi:hypothetical protein